MGQQHLGYFSRSSECCCWVLCGSTLSSYIYIYTTIYIVYLYICNFYVFQVAERKLWIVEAKGKEMEWVLRRSKMVSIQQSCFVQSFGSCLLHFRPFEGSAMKTVTKTITVCFFDLFLEIAALITFQAAVGKLWLTQAHGERKHCVV